MLGVRGVANQRGNGESSVSGPYKPSVLKFVSGFAEHRLGLKYRSTALPSCHYGLGSAAPLRL